MINLSFGEVTPEVLEIKEKRKINWKKIGKTLLSIYTVYLIVSTGIIYASTSNAAKNMSLYTSEIKKGIDNILIFNLTAATKSFENASNYLSKASSTFKKTETLRLANIILATWYLISTGERERLTTIHKTFLISEYMINGGQNIVTSLNLTLEAIKLTVKFEQFIDAKNSIELANEKALEALNNFSWAIDLTDINYNKLSEEERNATIALNNTLYQMFLLSNHLNILTYSMKQLIIAIETSKKAYSEMNVTNPDFNDLQTQLLKLNISLNEFERRNINETAKEFFPDMVYCMLMVYKWLLNIENSLRLSIQNGEIYPYKEWILGNYTLLCVELQYLTEI